MRFTKLTPLSICAAFLSATALVVSVSGVIAQTGPTATPAQIQLSTPITPTVPGLVITPATAVPTTAAAVVLEAFDTANVRTQPDTSASQLGTIQSGDLYPVIGRYFEWLQFQYPPSPNGTGWVFGQLVNVTGDVLLVPEVDLSTQPTIDPLAGNATSTQDVITRTPGGLLTATAFERFIAGNPQLQTRAPGQILPTFTYPPNAALIAPTPNIAMSQEQEVTSTSTTPVNEGIPPILPILIVGGLGLLGLAVSTLRRS